MPSALETRVGAEADGRATQLVENAIRRAAGGTARRGETNPDLPSMGPSSRERKRQRPQPLLRGGEDRVRNRRSDGGRPRLAGSARLLLARNDVDLDLRHLVQAEHGV